MFLGNKICLNYKSSVSYLVSQLVYPSGLVKRRYHSGASCVLFGTPRPPSPHDSLHSSPFYLKGPWAAATGKPTERRGCTGCNDKSKDHHRAHERRITPPQDLGLRYPWDSVSRRHKTSKLCMLRTGPCGTPYTHNEPTIQL